MKGASHKGRQLCSCADMQCPEQADVQKQKVAQWLPGAGDVGGLGGDSQVVQRSFGGSTMDCSDGQITLGVLKQSHTLSMGEVHGV